MKYIPHIVCLLLVVALGAILLLVVQQAAHLPPSNGTISYADFLAIILSALGVMLTALTIFLGVLAFVGWTTFESKMKSSSEEFLEKRFSPVDPRYAELVEEIKEDVRREVRIAEVNERQAKENLENENPTIDEDVE